MSNDKNYGIVVSIRIDGDVKKTLDEMAAAENRTLGGQIRHIIDQYTRPISEEAKK